MKIYGNDRLNFFGYKNILSGGIQGPRNETFYLSGELNNLASNHLEQYETLCNMAPEYKAEHNNIFTLLYTKNSEREFLILNREKLDDCEDLLFKQKHFSSQFYKYRERAILKAYTLFADITKHIMSGEYNTKDKGVVSAVQSIRFSLNANMDKEVADYFFLKSNLCGIPPAKWASKINAYISRNMLKYFK